VTRTCSKAYERFGDCAKVRLPAVVAHVATNLSLNHLSAIARAGVSF